MLNYKEYMDNSTIKWLKDTGYQLYKIAAISTGMDDNFYCVEEGACYRSAQLSTASLENYINKYNIRSVLNLKGAEETKQWWINEKRICNEKGVIHCDLLTDATVYTPKEDLATILQFFNEAPRPILIHCRAGAERTGEASALWALIQQKKTVQEALEQLTSDKGYRKMLYPKKRKFIEQWKGLEWFQNEYDPEKMDQDELKN